MTRHRTLLTSVLCGVLLFTGATASAFTTPPGQYRLVLRPDMIRSSSPVADFRGLVDEQLDLGDPPAGKPKSGWKIPSNHWRDFPFSATLDLGRKVPLATLWIFDTNNTGDVVVECGKPGAWAEVGVYDCRRYLAWASVPLDVETRWLRLTLRTPGANFAEIALDAYSTRGWKAVREGRAAAARRAAEEAAKLEKARQEALRRPLIELEPYGKLSVVDVIDCGIETPTHGFADAPQGTSRVENILGRACRVSPPRSGSASWFGYRVGQGKLLRPGGAYVLAVEYPEDAPRSMVVVNTGNETARGLHTGRTLGDAFRAKYVDHHCESLDIPLSGRWETWSLLVHLHDRFSERGLVRGAGGRDLVPQDGFDVTIAQFAAEHAPLSRGAAVARIRLLEVIDPTALAQPLRLPPDDLPRRRLFWREEMADGVLGAKSNDPTQRGIVDRLDWYRHKADRMRFLGMNTFAKDLLEFGACQHWDSTPHGGDQWVFHDATNEGLWAKIVALMGERDLDVLPYYEYSGSKGYKGLGNERRAKPLTRDDAYTHIQWIESANADITDPDTFEDFRKMLELTVVRLQDKAQFAGVWIRPRSQLPVGFGPRTLERFAKTIDPSGGTRVTRDALRADKELYERYLDWWAGKRREFLVRARDWLRESGVRDASVLFTGCPAEPGVGFADWQPRLVTDSLDTWRPILAQRVHAAGNGRQWQALPPADIVRDGLYLRALTAPGKSWGGWEVHHARPADDPQRYRDVDGVFLTHAINRLYTVASPRTFDAFRTRSGLAVVRHYGLNEHMMVDEQGRGMLGYFIADIERAGPYCMLAEAHAVANGDPTWIGYLVGANYGRGFPQYVRDFNAAFLSLPALPSRVVDEACADRTIVVREIGTARHGTWFAAVHTGLRTRSAVRIELPGRGTLRDAVTGERIESSNVIETSFYPCQLRTWHRAVR